MTLCCLFNLFVLCLQSVLVNSFLNIEELREMQYAVDILNQPVNSEEVNLSEGLKLASKYGQRYFCKLPNTALKMADWPQSEGRLPADYPIAKLLEPLREQPCLKVVKGWWTYEFCYMKYLHQYRSEDGEVDGDVISLGEYEAEFDWSDDQKVKAKLFKRKRVQKYHTQYYVNGTDCKILSQNRDSEIRYFCDESATVPFIERVDEPFTCSYIITVKTHLICSHPHTKLIAKSKADDIVCQPLLSAQSYRRFLDQQTKNTIEAYKEANALLQRKRDKLRFLLNELKTQVHLLDKPLSRNNDKLKLPVQSNDEVKDMTKEDQMKIDAQDLAIDFIQRFVPEDKIYDFSRQVQMELLDMTVRVIMRFKALPSADLARMVRFEIGTFLEHQEMKSENFFTKLFQDLSDHKSDKPESTGMTSSRGLHIKLRHIRGIAGDDEYEEPDESPDPAVKKLEEEIEKELREAGVSSKAHTKIEVHLITNRNGKDTLSESDAHHFKEALLEIMGGNSREEIEKERQERLSESYSMKYVEANAQFESRQNENEESSSSNS